MRWSLLTSRPPHASRLNTHRHPCCVASASRPSASHHALLLFEKTPQNAPQRGPQRSHTCCTGCCALVGHPSTLAAGTESPSQDPRGKEGAGSLAAAPSGAAALGACHIFLGLGLGPGFRLCLGLCLGLLCLGLCLGLAQECRAAALGCGHACEAGEELPCAAWGGAARLTVGVELLRPFLSAAVRGAWASGWSCPASSLDGVAACERRGRCSGSQAGYAEAPSSPPNYTQALACTFFLLGFLRNTPRPRCNRRRLLANRWNRQPPTVDCQPTSLWSRCKFSFGPPSEKRCHFLLKM